jgi:hypothetical protein
MADFKRGIKAGIITAIVYIVISLILGEIYQLSIPGSAFIRDFIYGSGLTPFSLTALTDPSFVISLFFQYVVRGIIFGAVFAALYSFLPGTKSVGKGVVLSLFLCIVALVETIYTTPGWPTDGRIIGGVYAYYGGALILSSISLALAGIISALVFGALTGFMWDRFRAKRLAEARKGSPVLLIGFILGGVTWVFFAVMFLLGVVIGGVPAIGPDFWWLDMLSTLVVFLGLFGWVLTLVAWRKTKRGESGFKWGVAGGVIMALTGIMLLPGALAITGGVLSGRKPASEPSTAEIGQ